MPAIPYAEIGATLDGEKIVVVHHGHWTKYPGAATPVGDFAWMARAEWEAKGKAVVLETLDAFDSRMFDGESEYKRLGPKGEKAFHRAHRFVGVQLGGASSDENTVEFAPYHLRAGGNLEGCDPGDRVLVPRDESNEAFVRAFELAYSRCRGYK